MAMERKTKAATESLALLLIIALILVGVNALSALGIYTKKDLTKSERYTLSKGSGKLLVSMKQTMHVDAYVTKGLPKIDAFVRDLRDLLQEYEDASVVNGEKKFTYTIIEAKDDDQKTAAKGAGLVEQPFPEFSETEDNKGAVAQGYMGIVFKYGAEKDAIKALSPDQSTGLEFWITNKIREIRDRGDKVEHKIGVLTGHDEMKLTEANLVPAQAGKPAMQDIITRNFPFYKLSDVDLKGGDAEIDDSLDGIIITQPGKDLTDKELRRIDQFLMKGKSLAMFASFVNIKANDATMNATLSAHGLDKLLDGYGIEMKKDVVLDFGRSFRVNIMTQGGMASAKFPQMIDVIDDTQFKGDDMLLDTSFAGFFRIEEVAMPFTSALVLHPEKQPDVPTKCADNKPPCFKIVARSTPFAYEKTDDTVDLNPFQAWKPKGKWEQFNLSASVEGRLKSAFPAGDKQGVETAAQVPDGKSARIFVISSSQYLANPFARAGNGQDMGPQFGGMPMGGDEKLLQLANPYAQQALTNTILSFKNTLDWLTGDVDLLAVSAKILGEPNLVYGDVRAPKFNPEESEDDVKKREKDLKQARKTQQSTIQWSLIFFVPIIFSLFGFGRWQWRKKARLNARLA